VLHQHGEAGVVSLRWDELSLIRVLRQEQCGQPVGVVQFGPTYHVLDDGIDERTSWFYEAVGVSKGMMGRTVGFGQVYLEASKDNQGNWLDGSKSYTLHVPPSPPVAQFWSFTVYDNETRCFVDTGVQPDRSSRNDIVTNSDGSVDLYFAPKAPAGKPAANWIETIPAKGWFAYFRLYGPTQPFFDRTWALPDVEEMN
jgi:hypothetical protein